MESETLNAFLCDRDPPFAKDCSPINLVTPDFPPTFVILAKNDHMIPTTHSSDLFQKLQDSGVDSEILEADGMNHGDAETLATSPPWREGCDWWDTVIQPSLDWAVARTG
jgi:acetyl esterase/lipase